MIESSISPARLSSGWRSHSARRKLAPFEPLLTSGELCFQPLAANPDLQITQRLGWRLDLPKEREFCRPLPSTLRGGQRIGDDAVADWRFHEVVAAGEDHDIFATVLLIDDRRRLPARR